MKKRRGWLLALGVVALVVAFFIYRASNSGPELHYETVKTDRGTIIAKVTATGTLSALVTVQVGSQVSGRISQILVDYNSPVKQGQLIAKIDPQLFEAAVEQARANLVAAKGNLTKAEAQALDAQRQFDRSQSLADRKLIAPADRDTAEANARAAKAQVEADKGAVAQAEASLHEAQVNLGYTNIISPTDGTVISRSVDVGQTVAASLQAPTLFLIAEDLKKMQVDTSVAEADVGKLHPEMTATFTVDAYPSERFTGVVRQIRNAPQNVQNVVTYDAVIDVANPELKLRPGMTANVVFVYAQKDDVLRASNAALRFRPSPALLAQVRRESHQNGATSGQARAQSSGEHHRRRDADAAKPDDPDVRTVWVLRDGVPERVDVKTGITDGTNTEVISGDLRPGDELITDVTGGEENRTPQLGGPGGGMRRLF